MSDPSETTGPTCLDCAARGCPTPGKCAEIERLRAALNNVTQCLDSIEMIECAKEALGGTNA